MKYPISGDAGGWIGVATLPAHIDEPAFDCHPYPLS